MDEKNKIYVVTTYSWGEAPTIFSCESENQAINLLNDLHKEELRIEIEENGMTLGENVRAHIDNDTLHAEITVTGLDGTEYTTDWWIVDGAIKSTDTAIWRRNNDCRRN